MKHRALALAAALCLAVGLAVPTMAASGPMTAEYFYTILNSATNAVNSVTASEDGTDVPTDQLWVTQTVLDEFQTKLDQAQAYYSVWVQAQQILGSGSGATDLEKAVAQAQANEAEYAALTLQNAIPDFQDARQYGTLSSGGPNHVAPDPSDEPDPEPEPEVPFSDVAEGDWYYDFVATVYDKQLFAGFDDGTFRPNEDMTYGQFLAVLSQFSGDTINTANAEVWYDPYVQWGMESGVLPGALWDGFDPTASITRQDMAVIFGLFLTEYEVSYTPVNTGAASFTDSGEIDSYAVGGVALCWQAGLMGGRPDGSFGPQETATRAEVAVTMVQMARVMGR